MFNKELKKTTIGDFPFVDLEDVNTITFNIILAKDGKMNAIIDFGYIDMDDDDYPLEYGLSLRTTIFEKNLVDVAKKVKMFLDLGMFENLIFLPESVCMDNNGEMKYEFSWDDYLVSDNVMIN